MPPSIGVNLRVTGHCSQGGRKHMEDMFAVAYQQTSDEKDLEYAYFGIFDGHGGQEAATFAKEHLLDFIVNQKLFWSESDDDILSAIRIGFQQTHTAMWHQLETWPKTATGLPSTSGTTASIAFIRKGKIYIGHVGDSSIVLGFQREGETNWKGVALTRDHKPENEEEIDRITKSGGKVIRRAGIPRVVWNRPRIGHKGPITRSTRIDEIPFLAVARSLGDLWSYNPSLDKFIVSPDPDVRVISVDINSHRCLIFGTDGLWNVLSVNSAVSIVEAAEKHNEKYVLLHSCSNEKSWINPSKRLVDKALERWAANSSIADNTSVVTLMLDPPGPPRTQVLLNQQQQQLKENQDNVQGVKCQCNSHGKSPLVSPNKKNVCSDANKLQKYDPNGGVAIFTRYPLTVSQSKEVHNSLDASNNNNSGNSKVHMVNNVLHRECNTSSSQSERKSVPTVSSHSEETNSKKCPDVPLLDAAKLTVSQIKRSKSFVLPREKLTSEVSSNKRRHSTMSRNELAESNKSKGEPRQKRRTKSDDIQPLLSAEVGEVNCHLAENERVGWPANWGRKDHRSSGDAYTPKGAMEIKTDENKNIPRKNKSAIFVKRRSIRLIDSCDRNLRSKSSKNCINGRISKKQKPKNQLRRNIGLLRKPKKKLKKK